MTSQKDHSHHVGTKDDSFTVRLCVHCHRSVKFRGDHISPRLGKRNQGGEFRTFVSANQFTNKNTNLFDNNKFCRDGEAQTKITVKNEEYSSLNHNILNITRSEEHLQKNIKESSKQKSQYISQDSIRPKTSLDKKHKSMRTFNFIESITKKPEDANGRRFVIYNQD